MNSIPLPKCGCFVVTRPGLEPGNDLQIHTGLHRDSHFYIAATAADVCGLETNGKPIASGPWFQLTAIGRSRDNRRSCDRAALPSSKSLASNIRDSVVS